MADLYETLGVPHDATKADLKSAYRRQAKTAHPDTGGDPAAFHALEMAYRILSDDEKRARYDEHGETDFQPDNTDGEAMSIIAAIVDRFINDERAKFKNLVGEIRTAIKGEIATARRNIDEGRKYELKTIDLQKRVKGKQGGALLISMFEHKLRDCREAIAALERQIVIRERALALVEDADFDAEKVSTTRIDQDVFTNAAAERLYRSAFFNYGGSTT